MLSGKNRTLAGFVLLALVLGYGGLFLTDLPTIPFILIVVVAGAAASMLVRKFLDVDG